MRTPGSDSPRHIFITGHARSGSTIVMQVLNSSPDILILYEAELYLFGQASPFTEYFNKRAVITTHEVDKGYFIPRCLPPGLDGFQTLRGLRRYYRLTGDKVALGPNRPEQVNIFHYLTGQHLNAFHVFAIRRPDAAVASMHKMFPETAAHDLIALWLDTMSLVVSCLSVIPRSHVVPLEQLSPAVLQRLAEFLHVEPLISPLSLFDQQIPTKENLAWLGKKQAVKISQCSELYGNLCSSYDVEALRFNNPRDAYGLPWQIIPELRKIMPEHRLLIDRIWEPATALTDPRRGAITAALNMDGISPADAALIEGYARDYPTDGFAHYALGFTLARSGDAFAPAIRELSLALECGYSEFWTRYNRGYAYARLREIERAIGDLERAAILDPAHRGVQEQLERLREEQRKRAGASSTERAAAGLQPALSE